MAAIRDTGATRPLPDYRYFRALSIDLIGRAPTRAEISAFEAPDFKLDAWIDAHLAGPSYAERLRRIYMDLLRLETAPTVVFEPASIMLHHAQVLGPDGAPIELYFRYAQRRVKPEIDGEICFTESESGQKFPSSGAAIGIAKPLSQALLDERTVVVKPWWLYADYRAANPSQRASPEWAKQYPGYDLFLSLFVGPDGKPTTAVRVCKEEAQVAEVGHVFVTGRVVQKQDPLVAGRLTRLPMDTTFAKANAGKSISCLSYTGFQSTTDCGCGVGLERCIPNAPNGFMIPIDAPLGVDTPFFASPRPAAAWVKGWWGEEAKHFLDRIFEDDRDVRELLTSRGTMINGPLAQFYRFFAGQSCCGSGTELGYAEPDPLFDPTAVPKQLVPEDVATWTPVADRGPHAAGLMTMPVFLMKYGSRRARAHVLYNAFLCKDFISESAKLVPSDQPDLTRRPGCANCHHRLEPMSAYFARVMESDWTFLPPSRFPLSLPKCATADPKAMPGACKTFYDPAFTDAKHTTLRGAYSSLAHADAGPAGLAQEIIAAPEFAGCVVRNVAQSLIGRQLGAEDDSWKQALAKSFVDGGYHIRPLVRAIVTSPRYQLLNDPAPVSK